LRLTAEIARWQESQRLRSYALALLESDAQRVGGIEPTDKVAQWAAWISGRADQLDPLKEVEVSTQGELGHAAHLRKPLIYCTVCCRPKAAAG
jgi:hypothetical protein